MEFRFLIFSISVLDRSVNTFRLSPDFSCRLTRLVVLFTKSSYERRHPLDRFENQPKVDFSSRQRKVLHLTHSVASMSIICELKLVRNFLGFVLPSKGLMFST